MRHATGVRQQLEQAENLAEVLDAAYQAFEEMLRVIRRYQDSRGPFYAALVMASAAAADGRNMLTGAPSLPPVPGQHKREEVPVALADPIEAAVSLTELCNAVSSRLRQAAASADADADSRACEDAAAYADEVQALATGTGS